MKVNSGMSFMLRLLLLVCVLIPAVQASAQQKFQINGRLKIDGGDLAGARIVVYRNGEKERVINTGLTKFSLDLEMNSNYLLSFEKDGFVSKKLSFNTKVPAAAALSTFTPFDYAVSLFKQYDDLNMVVFNQPVGVIRYEPGLGDFDYDTDYTKSIQAQLQQALADVEKRQKEEQQNAVSDAKQKAAEEKAQAKAKAEAEKQAQAQAKALAEAERQAAAKAKADAEALVVAKAKAEAQEKALANEAKLEAEKKKDPVVVADKPPSKPVAQPPVLAPINAAPTKVVAAPAATTATTPKRTAAAQREPLNTRTAVTISDTHVRREIGPVIGSETSTVGKATALSGEEQRPAVIEPEVWTDRNEELIIEPSKVMTVIQLTTGDVMTEYRKVIHKWGSTYYFKNGEACSQVIYEQEAMSSDRLAGASPRSKLDR